MWAILTNSPQCKRTNTWGGKTCPNSKLVQNFLMLRARLFIAMQILIFHSLHNVNIIYLHIRRCSLKKCFLWLDFNGDRKKTSLSPKLILLTPENKISNSLEVFFFLNFIILFSTIMVSQIRLVVKVPWSTGPRLVTPTSLFIGLSTELSM